MREPEWFREMCHKFPRKIALGIDARNGMVATHGWLETSDVLATAMARQFEDEPIAALIYTDIATDGMLQGPNLDAMREMAEAVQLPVIASGGVSNAADVAKLTETGVAGVIIGLCAVRTQTDFRRRPGRRARLPDHVTRQLVTRNTGPDAK